MNYLDLFSGIGGFALGAYWAGMKFENHLCSDIEKYPVELYKKRFPDSIQLGDIKAILFSKLKKDYPGEWIITGGFPCQDISVAGKGKGLIDEKGNKTRSGLWFEMLRGIRILRPRFVFIENVRALLGRGMETVLANLADIGYNAEWQIISAADMGAPHKRERIWIVAYAEWVGWGDKAGANCSISKNPDKQNLSQINRKARTTNIKQSGKIVADPESGKSRQQTEWEGRKDISGGSKKMADTMSKGLERRNGEVMSKRPGERIVGEGYSSRQKNYWTVEPAVGRLVNGLSLKLDGGI